MPDPLVGAGNMTRTRDVGAHAGARSRPIVRMRQARQLLHPSLRTFPWTPVVASGVVAVALVVGLTGDTGTADDNLARRILALRVAAVLLSIGVGFVLSDPAGQTVASSPTSELFRRAYRFAIGAAVVAAFWAIARAAPQGPIDALRVPTADLRTELAAMASLSVMVAAAAGRFLPDAFEGMAAGPVVVVAIGSAFLHDRWKLFSDTPGSAAWTHAHHAWAVVATGAMLVTMLMTVDGWAWRRHGRTHGRDHRPIVAARS
jgi:hypothetical protein